MKKYERPIVSVESLTDEDIIRTSESVTTEGVDVEWESVEYYNLYGSN